MFGWVLAVAGGVVALLLVIWLALGVVSNTTLSADPKNREVAAETTLGNLNCRKELRATFPFFVLKCRDASTNP